MSDLPATIVSKRDRLLQVLSDYGSCAIAYSGGVDSAVVAKAARLALGDAAVTVTGTSDSLAQDELDEAELLANLIGVRHYPLPTEEFSNPEYVANDSHRCFHCKTELYTKLQALADELGLSVIVNGTNLDDLDDFRPGIGAASDFGVRSPLAECGLTKHEVRQLAADWELPVADKPATPCLSSRVAFGLEVTPERLHRIDRAEQLIRSLGMSNVRVRYHEGDIARIESPVEELCELCQPEIREVLTNELKQLGFKLVTLDLEGFRSGSLVTLIQPTS